MFNILDAGRERETIHCINNIIQEQVFTDWELRMER